MTNLSEDPTYLVAGLLLLAGAFVVALNVTQQGKYLIRAGIVLGLVLVVVAVDWFWITDNERIEQVVYDLGRAVQSSDVEKVLSHMAPNVQFLQGETALSEDTTRARIRANLSQAQFEFVRVTDLQTSAGQQTRRGKAEFRVFTRGRSSGSAGALDGLTTWSLGFEETQPGVWMVNRISPASTLAGILALSGGSPTDGSIYGRNNGTSQPQAKRKGRRGGSQSSRKPSLDGFTKRSPEPG
jgi:ketosteroid isomerase-like protein